MILKKVEIQGFKTFADETVLEFPGGNGITAIVGPNGCGKSNLLDAIRWVTGEQSIKLLRGTSHEEIIFAGSEQKKPLSMAQVTLTIDNTDHSMGVDYTEVVISRRLYRSGESEYYLNKELCRLKDIQNLLMDTGIGRGAYSMIGQGQVAEILNSRPEDRRSIFEEAAGVNKYKTRKIASLRKLEATEQNLIRLQDIRSEIHQQLGPLEEQAKKAEEYKAIKTELGGLEIGMYKEHVDRLLKEKQGIVAQITEYQNRLQEAVLQGSDVEQKKKTYMESMASLEHQAQEKQLQIETLRREKEEISSSLKVNEERLVNLQQRLLQLADEQQKITMTREVLAAKKIDAEVDEKSSGERLRALEQELGLKTAETQAIVERYEALSREKEGIQMTLFDMEKEVSSVQNQLLDIQSKERFTAEELRRNEIAQLKLSDDYTALVARTKEVEARQAATREKITELRAVLAQLDQDIAALKDRQVSNKKEFTDLKEQLDTKTSRLELLKEMQKNFEGFFEGVRNFFQQRDAAAFPGIRGVVADIIKPLPKYEVALEVALGNRLQDIIVDNDDTAQRAIAFLKEKNLGRATFIVLAKVYGDAVTFKHQGVMLASELVDCAPEYKDVVVYLLGRILVAETMADAVRARDAMRHVKGHGVSRIVTLAGDIITPQGAYTGGAIKKQTTLLGRQREILELGNVLEAIRADLARNERAALDLEREAQEIAQKRTDTVAQEKHYEIEDKTLLNDRTRLDIEKKKLDDEIQATNNNIRILKEDVVSIQAGRGELAQRMEESTSSKQNLSQDITNKEQEMKAASEEKDRATHALTEIRISYASAKSQYEQVRNTIRTILDGQAEQEKQFVEKQAEQEQMLQRRSETESAIATALEKLPSFTDRETVLVQEIDAGRLERERILNDLEVLDRKAKEANEVDREWRTKISSEEVRVARIDMELTTIEQRVSAEYEMTLEMVLKADAVIEDFEKVRDHVERLKRTLKRMEPVNLLAIEEFRAQKERLTFIEDQCRDLDEAKKNLQTLIKELDTLALKQFTETFEIVKKNFEEIFTKLFEGGKAELKLLEDANVLEAGIEIYAQPPGKKRQSLSLLSGGEKTMTTIALLFALMKAKPSPFCVMDEIDAALDEANVSRFTMMLKDYASQSHILLITHNKRSMSVADDMYGVTMERNGVSKLVSMKLVEA